MFVRTCVNYIAVLKLLKYAIWEIFCCRKVPLFKIIAYLCKQNNKTNGILITNLNTIV